MSETIIRSPAVAISYVLELWDFGNNFISDITDRLDINGSVISRRSSNQIDGVATFVLSDVTGINPGIHQLRAKIRMTDNRGTGGSRTWDMGAWVMTPFAIPLSNTQSVTVECYEVSTILATHLRNAFSAVPGESIQNAILRLLSREEVFTLTVDLPTIPYELISSPLYMPLEQLTYLDIVNDLLLSSDHDALYMTRDGRITTYAWDFVENFPPVWNFDTETEGNWISGPNTVLEPVTEPVPNEWVGICSPEDVIGVCSPVVIQNNDPSNPFSVPNQGGRIFRKVVEIPVSTTANLEISVQRVAEADYLRARRIRVFCGPVPTLWHNDVVNVNIPRYGIINELGIVKEWHLPFNQRRQRAEYIIDLGYKGLEQ